jgi:hypothetical protein
MATPHQEGEWLTQLRHVPGILLSPEFGVPGIWTALYGNGSEGDAGPRRQLGFRSPTPPNRVIPPK